MHLIREGVELRGESGTCWLPVKPMGQDNVWIAVDKDNHRNIVILKSPGPDDPEPWAKFRHEMVMHELFKSCPSIRKQVDRIPPESGHNPPVLVLEILATTLWQARAKRPFSKGEVVAVASAILQGLKEIHAQGLVYADLKMENIMLNNFDITRPSNGGSLTVKLCDLGIVMPPAYGKVQPVAFRAPEVHFKGEITSKADIWAFGLVYCHLLEAQHRFSATGLYDDLETAGGTMGEREQAVRQELGDNFDIRSVDYYQDCALPHPRYDREAGEQWERLRARGLAECDIEFLQWVLQVDPTKRPSAQAILKSSWFSQGDLLQQDTHASPTKRIRDVTANESEAVSKEPKLSNAVTPGYVVDPLTRGHTTDQAKSTSLYSTKIWAPQGPGARGEVVFTDGSADTYQPTTQPSQHELTQVSKSPAKATSRPSGATYLSYR